MRVSRVLPHAILALGGLALVLALRRGDPEAGRRRGGTIVFACEPERLGAITWRGEAETVRIEPADAETGARWIRVTPRGSEDGGERFRGGAAVARWTEGLAPLRARRVLGDLDARTRAALDLEPPRARLTLRCGARETSFDVGGRAFGRGDRYLRRAEGGPVFLVARERLAPLERAPRALAE